LPENLAATAVEFSADELTLLDRTFTLGSMAGDRYPTELLELAAK
jgi:hypothetical protein